MRMQIPALLAVFFLGPFAHADDKHHPPEAAKAPATASASGQRFNAAYDRMRKMAAQMEQIKATKDPKERERLMQQHLESMHEGAQALRAAGGCTMPMTACPMMGGAHGKQVPAERMDMMEKRMDMLQMMMEQMVEREGMKPMPKQE